MSDGGIPLAPLRSAKGGDSSLRFGMTGGALWNDIGTREGGEGRPLRLRKGTRTSVAMFAGDAW